MLQSVLAFAMVVGGGVTAWADPPKELSEGTKRELKKLEGKWQAMKFVHSDRQTTPDDLIVEFKGSTINFATVASATVVSLDPATDPMCLDFQVRVGSGILKKGSTYESTYKRDGDTLTWVFYHGRGKNRPTTFDRPTDPGVTIMVFNRVTQ